MNELQALLALIPLAFITLNLPQKIRLGLCWLSVVIAAIWLSYFLWLQQGNPMLWSMLLPFLGLVLADLIQEKKVAPFTFLSVIFVSLASITSDFGAILIFLAFSDFFLEMEIFAKGKIPEKNKAIKNVYRSLLSLLPLGVAVTLNVGGSALTVLVSLTILLRIFSWPVEHWIGEETSPLYYLIIGAVSTFALWHGIDFSGQGEWPLIWLIAAAVLSLGIKYVEIYIALTLGLFSLSPQLGLLSIGLWPLTLERGITSYVIYIFIALGGALIADSSSKVIVENASYALSFITAVLLARSLVAIKIKIRVWYKELTDFLLAGLATATFFYFYPLPNVTMGPIGFLFCGVFVVTFALGKFLLNKKPKLFNEVPRLRNAKSPLFFKSVEFLRERGGPAPSITQRKYLIRFFNALDSESHLVWLLGALGLALWWGAK
jgi:hypothetical protein